MAQNSCMLSGYQLYGPIGKDICDSLSLVFKKFFLFHFVYGMNSLFLEYGIVVFTCYQQMIINICIYSCSWILVYIKNKQQLRYSKYWYNLLQHIGWFKVNATQANNKTDITSCKMAGYRLTIHNHTFVPPSNQLSYLPVHYIRITSWFQAVTPHIAHWANSTPLREAIQKSDVLILVIFFFSGKLVCRTTSRQSYAGPHTTGRTTTARP